MYLTDTDTGVTYCRVVWRSLDTPVNMSLCPTSNGPLSTGVYSVEVYDIESDGSVSSVPALAGEVVTVFGPSTVYGPSLEDGHQIASCGLSTHCGPSVMQGQSGRSSLYCKAVFWERLECLINRVLSLKVWKIVMQSLIRSLVSHFNSYFSACTARQMWLCCRVYMTDTSNDGLTCTSSLNDSFERGVDVLTPTDVGVGIGTGGGGAVMVTASVMILVLCLIRLKKQKISALKSGIMVWYLG